MSSTARWLRMTLALGALLLACDPAPFVPSPPRCPHAVGTAMPLFASTSDYSSGSLCELTSAASCVDADRALLSPDSVLAWHDATTLVSLDTSSVSDSVTFFDVAGLTPALVRSVSASLQGEMGPANARAYAAVSSTEGYVARFNRTAILRVDARTGTTRLGPDLGSLRGGGAHPRPRRLAWVRDELWVSLLRLDESQTAPTAPGAIAVLDPVTDTVRDLDANAPGTQVIELPFANPLGPLSVRGGRVLVAAAGSYRALDGGVVMIDAQTRATTVVLREDELGANVDAAIWLDDERILLRVVSRAGAGLAIDFSTLIEWSLASRSARPWLRVREWTLTEPVLGADGLVYVGDRGYEPDGRAHGLRVFDAASGAERTARPVSCGLQPYDLLPRLSAR